jgi:hypothetical protein
MSSSNSLVRGSARPIRRKSLRRLILLAIALSAVLGLTLAGTATAATSNKYTVTRTVGPYNGAAGPEGPGYIGPDSEAKTVSCNPGDTILAGSAKINRKTSYGTAKRDVVNLDVIGVFWDDDAAIFKWGAFISVNGNKGWNSVTLTVRCEKAPIYYSVGDEWGGNPNGLTVALKCDPGGTFVSYSIQHGQQNIKKIKTSKTGITITFKPVDSNEYSGGATIRCRG